MFWKYLYDAYLFINRTDIILIWVNGFILCVTNKSVIGAVIIRFKDECPIEKGKCVADFIEIKPARDNKKEDNQFY